MDRGLGSEVMTGGELVMIFCGKGGFIGSGWVFSWQICNLPRAVSGNSIANSAGFSSTLGFDM